MVLHYGVGDEPHDNDRLPHCDLQLDVINTFLCNSNALSLVEVKKWQKYLFSFSQLMADLFQVDVKTKLHQIMHHVKDQITNMGCIFRSLLKIKNASPNNFSSATIKQINIFQALSPVVEILYYKHNHS